MKVLHYSLGFSPYRTGGLVRFCIDLMKFQQSKNIEVCMLWPGRIKTIDKRVKVIEGVDKLTGLKSYELVNPLPVSLDEGIKETNEFIKNVDTKYYKDILKRINPDCIHVHTLMGMHKSFLEVAKELKIKLIFTPHDYFGLCPKLTFYNNNKVCNQDQKCQNCTVCNEKALDLRKIYLLQHPCYRVLKNSALVKFLRKKHRQSFFENSEENLQNNNLPDKNNFENYIDLRNYYIDMIRLFDVIHFNSSLTKEIYQKYVKLENFKVINITHGEIKDNRKIKKVNKEKVRIAYMASTKPYKGFYLLLKALDEIWNEDIFDFNLNVFAETNEKRAYMNVKGSYNINELKSIFEETDILIVPSIWYETYGFTVLEAISNGVPVIVTNNVGAKDIIGKAGIVIEPNNYETIKEAIKHIINNKELLENMNKETFNCTLPNMEDMLELLEG